MKRKEKVKTCGNCAHLYRAKLNVIENGKLPKFIVWVCEERFCSGKKPNGEDVCEWHTFKHAQKNAKCVTQSA
jgi:hypothetical protein